MVACVVLSELEGRGHSCLMLDDLAADPARAAGLERRAVAARWPAAAGAAAEERQGLGRAAGRAPSRCGMSGDFDFDQPLVLDGERLYLRRYWRDETLVADTHPRARRARRAKSTRPRCATGSTPLFASDRSAPRRRTGKSWPAPSRCAARSRSSPAAPAPARPTRWRACWRCCSPPPTDAAQPAHRAGRADRQGRGAPEAVDRQGAERAGRQGRRRAAAAGTDRPHGRGAHAAQPAGRASRHARVRPQQAAIRSTSTC